MTWPGIPSGRGTTCIEEGCGNPKRARGNDCRACYRRKWMQHKRAAGDLEDGQGGYEVHLSPVVVRALDRAVYEEWQRARDEYT
jgi:hypothetical protein